MRSSGFFTVYEVMKIFEKQFLRPWFGYMKTGLEEGGKS